MRVIVCENYEEMSAQGAKIIEACITMKPDCVLGLATGSTPVGMYNILSEKYKNGEIDFKDVTSFNLDEYYPIKNDNDQSYHYFMNENLFKYVNIKKSYIPNGETDQPEKECQEYEQKIKNEGGIDLQVLGIGQNGHIGFNEPDENLNAVTHVTGLTESTISANSRFFSSVDEVPTKALTMGMATIMNAKTIMLLASGKNKHEVVKKLCDNDITTDIPATMLKMHPDVILICDKEAFEG